MTATEEIVLPKFPDWASKEALCTFQVRETTQYAMFVIDSAGIILAWNAGVERLLGYSEMEWLGQHASIIFTPSDQGKALCEEEMKRQRKRAVPLTFAGICARTEVNCLLTAI